MILVPGHSRVPSVCCSPLRRTHVLPQHANREVAMTSSTCSVILVMSLLPVLLAARPSTRPPESPPEHVRIEREQTVLQTLKSLSALGHLPVVAAVSSPEVLQRTIEPGEYDLAALDEKIAGLMEQRMVARLPAALVV